MPAHLAPYTSNLVAAEAALRIRRISDIFKEPANPTYIVEWGDDEGKEAWYRACHGCRKAKKPCVLTSGGKKCVGCGKGACNGNGNRE